MARTLHFKSKEAYRKFLSYGHMRTRRGIMAKRRSQAVFATTPGSSRVYIRGRLHHVKHRR